MKENRISEKNVKTYFDLIKEQQIKKLTDVGFTKEQARVLIEIIQEKVFSGGLF